MPEEVDLLLHSWKVCFQRAHAKLSVNRNPVRFAAVAADDIEGSTRKVVQLYAQ